MNVLLREPLLHFLLLGTCLFVLYGALDREGAGADDRTIVVNRDKLLTYLQYRSRAFDEERFNEVLDGLSDRDFQHLVDGYVREEALHREAKALELGANDYISRLRLVQQLEFVLRGFADAGGSPTAQEIERHYEANRSDYQEQPRISFTHLFFSIERRSPAAADAARAKLEALNDDRVSATTASPGDPFLHRDTYVSQGPELVASHFGTEMQQALFTLEPGDGNWHGPFRSPYGFHLVLLTGKEPARVSPLEEVREKVVQDLRRSTRNARFERSIQAVVGAYEVDVRQDIRIHEDR